MLLKWSGSRIQAGKVQAEYAPERPERSNARGALSSQTASALPRSLLSSRRPRRQVGRLGIWGHSSFPSTHWESLEKPPMLGVGVGGLRAGGEGDDRG